MPECLSACVRSADETLACIHFALGHCALGHYFPPFASSHHPRDFAACTISHEDSACAREIAPHTRKNMPISPVPRPLYPHSPPTNPPQAPLCPAICDRRSRSRGMGRRSRGMRSGPHGMGCRADGMRYRPRGIKRNAHGIASRSHGIVRGPACQRCHAQAPAHDQSSPREQHLHPADAGKGWPPFPGTPSRVASRVHGTQRRTRLSSSYEGTRIVIKKMAATRFGACGRAHEFRCSSALPQLGLADAHGLG